MKRNLILSGIALFTFLAVPFVASAQNPNIVGAQSTDQKLTLTVNGSALLAIFNTAVGASNTNIAMSLSGATTAGAAISPTATDNASRLRISSLNDGATTRTITAQITPAMTSDGTQLFVTLTDPKNFQLDPLNAGTCSATKELTSGDAQTVVTGIKTCWSGTETNSGYQITYLYQKKADATNVKSSAITVTYTISNEG